MTIFSQFFSRVVRVFQIWDDIRLSWNATEFDNLSVIYVKPTEIWTPDIALTNKWVIGSIHFNLLICLFIITNKWPIGLLYVATYNNAYTMFELHKTIALQYFSR